EQIRSTLVIISVKDGKADGVIRKAADSKSIDSRSMAAYILARAGVDDRKLALKLLEDKEPLVRFQAASGLLHSGVKEAVPELMRLLTDAPATLAFQAEDWLFRIAGDKPPNVNLGKADEPDRNKVREAWENWWKKNGDAIDLAKLDLDKALK